MELVASVAKQKQRWSTGQAELFHWAGCKQRFGVGQESIEAGLRAENGISNHFVIKYY